MVTSRPQSLNGVHHRLGGLGSTEDQLGAAGCGKPFSVADNFIRAEFADEIVVNFKLLELLDRPTAFLLPCDVFSRLV